MKNNLSLLVFFLITTVYSQTTTVSFVNPSQEIEYDSKTEVFTLKLEVKDIESYLSNKNNNNLNVELFSILDTTSVKFLPTKTTSRDVVILPINYSNPIEIEIPFDHKKMKDIGIITFELKKKGANADFSIGQQFHTVYLKKKKETPTAKIGITALGGTNLEIDYKNDYQVEIPFKIKSEGYLPIEKDGITVKIKIDGLEGDEDAITESFKVIGQESQNKIVINNDDDPKKYKEILKKISNKEELKLELENIENKSKKKTIKDEKTSSITYKIKSKTKTQNRYNFYVGTNFDLKDRFEATSFYAEIDAWLPELIKNKWGIRAGLYKNNNSRSQEEFANEDNVLEVVNQTADSITYQNKRVRTVPSVSIENFGLYFQALFKLIDTKNFTGHIAAHFEAIERNEKFTFNNSDLITLGTRTISVDSLSRDRTLQFHLTRERDFTRRYYDAYYGLGFPMNFHNDKNTFSIFLNPVFGFGDPGLALRDGRDFDESNKFFGIFEFSLIEENFGIKLSGEIRKYFGFLQDPIVSINLSKKINLSSLFDTKEE